VSARAIRAERAAKTQRGGIRFLEPSRPKLTRRELAICLCLALATLLVYFRTFGYDFVAYDDDYFVYLNPVIKAGLKASGAAWAFGLHLGNWHPLTWISYLIDRQLFGMHAGGFHAVNVLLHAASSVLLFVALFRMTGRAWRCAIVAAVFALHPLHVESVAWVSERKDVLSTLLEMIGLLLYVRYVDRPTTKRFLQLCLAFACAVMAKPMVITFPLILLLLDLWPLQRISWPPRWPAARRLVIEKLPLLLISLVASVLTVIAQKAYGTVASLESIPLTTRLANAVTEYAVYLKQAIWPSNLAVLYPTAPPAPGAATVAAIVLLILTAAVVLFARRRPYLVTGWLWYLVMLAPVIGLVQVGAQSRADRYMYVPLVGVTVAVVWLIADGIAGHASWCNAGAVLAGIVIVALAAGSWRQIGYWKDSRKLFEHTLAVTRNNFIMTNNLGVVLARAGDDRAAMVQYAKAIAINPDYAEAQGNLGNVMLRNRLVDSARPLLEKAVRLKPEFPMAQLDLGIVEASSGDFPAAIAHLNEALRMTPEDPEVHSNLCYALQHSGRIDEAIAQCRQALQLRPDYPDAQFNLRNALAAKR
jgi:protein O-mannosyl-transferase